MKALVLMLVLMVSFGAYAETVFRIVHPDGTVEFTDDPLRGGDPITVHPVPTVPAITVAPPSPATRAPGPETSRYQQIQILSPEQDQVIWFDGIGVHVSVATQPPLYQQHRIAIEMNGERVAEGPGSSFLLSTVYRGSHILRALVLDQQGQTIQSSDPVTFHFRQHSVRP